MLASSLEDIVRRGVLLLVSVQHLIAFALLLCVPLAQHLLIVRKREVQYFYTERLGVDFEGFSEQIVEIETCRSYHLTIDDGSPAAVLVDKLEALDGGSGHLPNKCLGFAL